MEQVYLRGMEIEARHGCQPDEQLTPQLFCLNVTVDVITPDGRQDRIEDALDYRAVADICRRVMSGPPRRLMETLANEIADGIFELEEAAGVEIEIEKCKPPIADYAGVVGVRIYREAEME